MGAQRRGCGCFCGESGWGCRLGAAVGRPTRGAASLGGGAMARRWLRGEARRPGWLWGSYSSPTPTRVAFTPRPRRLSMPPTHSFPALKPLKRKLPILPPPRPPPTAAPSPAGPPQHTHAYPRPARLRAADSQLQPLFRALRATEPLPFVLPADDPFPPFPPSPFPRIRSRPSSHAPVPPPSCRPHVPGAVAVPASPSRTRLRAAGSAARGGAAGGGRGCTGNRRLVRAVFVFLSPLNARLRREDYTFIVAAE